MNDAEEERLRAIDVKVEELKAMVQKTLRKVKKVQEMQDLQTVREVTEE